MESLASAAQVPFRLHGISAVLHCQFDRVVLLLLLLLLLPEAEGSMAA